MTFLLRLWMITPSSGLALYAMRTFMECGVPLLSPIHGKVISRRSFQNWKKDHKLFF